MSPSTWAFRCKKFTDGSVRKFKGRFCARGDKPNLECLDIDCYVDADFAGLWPHEDKLDPVCVKSRTGHVICFANCPIVWKSRLQDTIALSTMEAEHMALSSAMKELIPFQELFRGVAGTIGLETSKTTFRTSVHEDNEGALTLAKLEPGRHTPRSKHHAIKCHWFRSHLRPNKVEIKSIDTKEQRADIMTKGLPFNQFKVIRRLLCGWQMWSFR